MIALNAIFPTNLIRRSTLGLGTINPTIANGSDTNLTDLSWKESLGHIGRGADVWCDVNERQQRATSYI